MESCAISVFASSWAFFPRFVIIVFCPWQYCILVLSVEILVLSVNVAYRFISDVNVNGFYTVLDYSLPRCDLQLMYGIQIHNSLNTQYNVLVD